MTCFRTHFFCFIGKPVLSLLLVLCPFLSSQAVTKEFVLRFHFRLDNARYETAYMDNDVAENALSSFLRKVSPESIQDVRVTAYASPESSLSYNEELCGNRLNAMRSLINSRVPQLAGKTSYRVGGEAWDMIRQQVKADASLKRRSPETYRTITDILDDPSITNDTRKELLKSRLPKNWYGYLRWIHYREVRFCEVRVLYKDAAEPEVVPAPKAQPAAVAPVAVAAEPQHDTVFVTRIDTVFITKTDTVYVNTPAVPKAKKEKVKKEESGTKRPVLGISTNILYDAAITPNVALELPMGKHWSLLAEYTFPWWVNKQNDRAWQIQKWDLGLRYWLGRKRDRQNPYNQLTGHFFGVDLGLGYYDIEPRHMGYQGEFLTAGLEYGYAWRLGEHWRMSAFVAAGWMGTRYRRYTGNDADTKLLYKYDGRFTWMGPTKLGLSFQYVFTKKKQK